MAGSVKPKALKPSARTRTPPPPRLPVPTLTTTLEHLDHNVGVPNHATHSWNPPHGKSTLSMLIQRCGRGEPNHSRAPYAYSGSLKCFYACIDPPQAQLFGRAINQGGEGLLRVTTAEKAYLERLSTSPKFDFYPYSENSRARLRRLMAQRQAQRGVMGRMYDAIVSRTNAGISALPLASTYARSAANRPILRTYRKAKNLSKARALKRTIGTILARYNFQAAFQTAFSPPANDRGGHGRNGERL